MKNFCLLACAIFFHNHSFSQQIFIGVNSDNHDQTFSTCDGFIIDSGGQGGSGYSNDEYTVVTICPDSFPNTISIVFNLFDLDLTDDDPSPENENYDVLRIYDGTSIDVNTLGTYSGTELQGVTVQATELNETGCLTLEFYSNSIGTGQFTANANCETPCSNPQASAGIVGGITTDSIRVCPGELVTFENQGSFAQPGFSLVSYAWDFMDGTSANGETVTHAYHVPGHYRTQLLVTDDNGCTNPNLVDLQVLVATNPDFSSFPTDTAICLGEAITLVANPPEYQVDWAGFTSSETVDDGCLTDDLLGVSQNIDLLQTGFAAGTTIQSEDQIHSVCLDIEHSFMGDLVIILKCPSGQEAILHQQNSTSTFLGVPVGTDNVDCDIPETMGVPYTYCFTTSAAQTWAQWEDDHGPGTLPAGDYLPIQPFSNLVGCPTNGLWTISVVDNWASDDGVIFGFELILDSLLYPDAVEFEPLIGSNQDSSFWVSPPFVSSISMDANTIDILPTEYGVFSYEYSVTDDFGCTNLVDLEVIVDSNIHVFAGNDMTLCANTEGDLVEVQLNASSSADLSVEGDVGNYVIQWSPPEWFDNPTILNPVVNLSESQLLTLTIYPEGRPACASSDQIDLSVIVGPFAGTDGVLEICQNANPVDLFPILGVDAEVGGVWYNSIGNMIEMPYDPLSMPPGNYWYVIDENGCSDSAKVEVTILNTEILQVSMVPISCHGLQDGSISFQGVNFDSYSINGGAPVLSNSAVLLGDLAPGDYMIEIFSNQGCSDSEFVSVVEPEPLTVLETTVLDVSCFGLCNGQVEIVATGGVIPYTYNWPEGIIGNQYSASGSGMCADVYQMNIQDANGCQAQTTFTVSEPPNVLVELAPDTASGCTPHEVSFMNMTISDSSAIHSTFIDFGDGFSDTIWGGSSFQHTYDESGVYDVFVQLTLDNGCVFSETFSELVEAYSRPTAEFILNPSRISMQEPVTNVYSSSFPNIVEYEWTIEEGTPQSSTSQSVGNLSFPSERPGSYPIILRVEDENGCQDTIRKFVTVSNDVVFYAPNAFTPDGDEHNQRWELFISGIDLSDFTLRIFNRWGEQIWENHDPDVGWDGTYKGKIVQSGSYAWIIQCTDGFSDKRYAFRGHVNVLK